MDAHQNSVTHVLNLMYVVNLILSKMLPDFNNSNIL